MNIEKFIQEYKDYLESKKLIVYGGNSENMIFRDLLDNVCQLITGFDDPGISISTDSVIRDEEDKTIQYDYKVRGGGEWQYNSFVVDLNFKLKEIEGDGARQLRRVFNFLQYMDKKVFMDWKDAISVAYHIAYYGGIDKEKEEEERSKSPGWFGGGTRYINFSKETFTQYKAMNKIHKSLYKRSNKEISLALKKLLPVWKTATFKHSGWLSQNMEGEFTKPVPDLGLKENKDEIIIFPGESRGEICTQYLVTNDMNLILKKKIGSTLKLRNVRKGSKTRTYKVMEHKNNSTALRRDDGKLEFVTHLGSAEDCFDALFPENRAVSRAWLNKKCKLIK